MLPAKLKKIDMSVSLSSASHPSILSSPPPNLPRYSSSTSCLSLSFEGLITVDLLVDHDGGGAETLPSLWETPKSQERPHEDAEGVSFAHCAAPEVRIPIICRIANTLTLVIMLCQKRASLPRAPSEQLYLTLESEIPLPASSKSSYDPHSIPHASSPPLSHQGLSISPTNSTSPVKESALASPDGNEVNDVDIDEQ